MKEGDEQLNNSLLEKRYLAAVFSSPEEVKQWNNEQWTMKQCVQPTHIILCTLHYTYHMVKNLLTEDRKCGKVCHSWKTPLVAPYAWFTLSIHTWSVRRIWMISLYDSTSMIWCQTMSFTTCGYSVKIILNWVLPVLQTHFYCHAMHSDYKWVGVSKFNFCKREYTFLKCQNFGNSWVGRILFVQKLQSLIHSCFSLNDIHVIICLWEIFVLKKPLSPCLQSYTSFYSEYYYLIFDIGQFYVHQWK